MTDSKPNLAAYEDHKPTSGGLHRDALIGHQSGDKPLLDDDELSDVEESTHLVSPKDKNHPGAMMLEVGKGKDIFIAAPFRRKSAPVTDNKANKNSISPKEVPVNTKDVFAQAPFKMQSAKSYASEINHENKNSPSPQMFKNNDVHSSVVNFKSSIASEETEKTVQSGGITITSLSQGNAEKHVTVITLTGILPPPTTQPVERSKLTYPEKPADLFGSAPFGGTSSSVNTSGTQNVKGMDAPSKIADKPNLKFNQDIFGAVPFQNVSKPYSSVSPPKPVAEPNITFHKKNIPVIPPPSSKPGRDKFDSLLHTDICNESDSDLSDECIMSAAGSKSYSHIKNSKKSKKQDKRDKKSPSNAFANMSFEDILSDEEGVSNSLTQSSNPFKH